MHAMMKENTEAPILFINSVIGIHEEITSLQNVPLHPGKVNVHLSLNNYLKNIATISDPKFGMCLPTYLFFFQLIIFCSQNVFVTSKPMVGESVTQSELDEFPYIVSICSVKLENPFRTRNHYCTGILVTRMDVLTAAHCMVGKYKEKTRVIVGSTNYLVGMSYVPVWWLSYNEWIQYSGRNSQYAENDLLIMRLHRDVGDEIEPASISTIPINNFYGLNVQIASWGAASNNKINLFMKKVTMNVLSNSECEDRMQMLEGTRRNLQENRFCTIANPYALMYTGDSGAPVIFMNTVIGMYQKTAPLPNQPLNPRKVNIHFSLHNYLDFIMTVTQPSFSL